ncbi:substrate-binding domain-containing protein [Chitinimonas lacunae]|uniref:Substrate-binding domain-containing protein n=1 Tax=Chitinimonas lacunae TaxID=1963018 RepID=A0ABV8MVS1_9NEIS
MRYLLLAILMLYSVLGLGASQGPSRPFVFDSGVPAQRGKTVVYIAEDLRNGGIAGVMRGMREAVAAIGWRLYVVDAQGSDSGRHAAFDEALALHPDGVVIGGMDAVRYADAIARFEDRPVIGWHAGPNPGPIAGTPVRFNVTTDTDQVARMAANAAVVHSRGRAGVVIFTDSNFAIATRKTQLMAAVIKRCPECVLLEIRDIAISQSHLETPTAVRELLARHGERWTHSLAINDIYFDHAEQVFASAKLPLYGRISCISAGDGSASAYQRIRLHRYQTATVSEPLNFQGWQIVDELNRLFANRPPSGYVTPAKLITFSNINRDGGRQSHYDPENGYRQAYREMWRRQERVEMSK